MNSLRPDHIAFVLVSPRIPENIGATARAMMNMGLHRLLVVRPAALDDDRMGWLATGPSAGILEDMEVYDALPEALAPFQYVVGTTARTGSNRPAMRDPRRLARELVSISQNNHVAILFGSEDRGLTNAHLRLCHRTVTIPTSDFSSLNLAQAVMILSYELHLAGMKPSQESVPRLANNFELEGMYAHLKEVLTKIGFINPQNPEHWMLNVRRFLSRIPLRAREVRVIRGVCRQIDWYTGQRGKRGNLENH